MVKGVMWAPIVVNTQYKFIDIIARALHNITETVDVNRLVNLKGYVHVTVLKGLSCLGAIAVLCIVTLLRMS